MKKLAPFAVVVLLSVSACTPIVAKHGNLLEDSQIAQIELGKSTRSDVLHVLGSPTTQSTFNPDIWYYIGQITEKRGILDQEIKKERIFEVTFNKDGILQSVEDKSGHRNDIPYDRSKTPTNGNELTILQQLLGNMGRFNAPQSSPTDLGR